MKLTEGRVFSLLFSNSFQCTHRSQNGKYSAVFDFLAIEKRNIIDVNNKRRLFLMWLVKRLQGEKKKERKYELIVKNRPLIC